MTRPATKPIELPQIPPPAIELLARLAQSAPHARGTSHVQSAPHHSWRVVPTKTTTEKNWIEIQAAHALGIATLWLDENLLAHLLAKTLHPWSEAELEDSVLELAVQLALPQLIRVQLRELRLRRAALVLPPEPLAFGLFATPATTPASTNPVGGANPIGTTNPVGEADPVGETILAAAHAPVLASLFASLSARETANSGDAAAYPPALHLAMPLFCGHAALFPHEIQGLGEGDIILLAP